MKRPLVFFLLSALIGQPAEACTTIIVGRGASANGSILVARNDDGPGTTAVNFVYHAPRDEGYELRSTIENHFTYAMPAHTMGFTGSPRGPANAFDESGFNDAGVGVSATETIVSNPATLAVDPYVKDTGVVEDVITTFLLAQAKTARDGVMLLGRIIEQKGAAEGFGVAFVDQNEAWYLENAGGHQWLAVKIPDDSYFVSGNQSRLGTFDPKDHANVATSPGLIAFAAAHGLYDRKRDGAFSFRTVFGRDNATDARYNYPRMQTLQAKFSGAAAPQSSGRNDFPTFLRPDRPISVGDVQNALRDYYAGSSADPYTSADPTATARPISVYRTYQSHILEVRRGLSPAIANVEHLNMGMTALGAYLPFYQGAQIPEIYQGATDQADDRSAFWRFRRVQLLAMQDFAELAPIVRETYDRFEREEAMEQERFERDYGGVVKTDPLAAKTMLDRFTSANVAKAMEITRALENRLVTVLSLHTNKKYKFPGA